MSLTVYFLRHGETESSRNDGFCGVSDPDLTDVGKAMAEAFAKAYQSFQWEAIYVSPMKRTVATATPICELTGLEMQLRDGLKEMDFGQWEGKDKPAVHREFPDDYVRWLTEPAWNPPTGGETAVQVGSRAALVMAEIEEKHTSGNVLVVSHKSTTRIVLCNLLGIDLGRYRDRVAMPVASVSMIEFDVHGPLLRSHGDRAHLPAELRNLPGT